jgi:hypothetical protein
MAANFRPLAAVCIACALVLVFITVAGYAYIDPSAAGLISQILTPALVAAVVSRRGRRLTYA